MQPDHMRRNHMLVLLRGRIGPNLGSGVIDFGFEPVKAGHNLLQGVLLLHRSLGPPTPVRTPALHLFLGAMCSHVDSHAQISVTGRCAEVA
jgi:hypothetical protein